MSKGSVYKSDIACYVLQCICIIYTVFQKKIGPFVISSYLCFTATNWMKISRSTYEVLFFCEYGINFRDLLAILC